MHRIMYDYYRQPATVLAPDLLGKILCRQLGDEIVRLRITETECYHGETDTACHASRGKTPRTKALYEQGGIAYIYLCYGIHHLFNIVAGDSGFPGGVLIRGVEGYSGPGRLTKALGIDRSLYGIDLVKSDQLWLEDDGFKPLYKATKRIGIDYAEPEDRDRLWRFVVTK
ncbi:MAG: DNA-3-methyladenine glycosylase [Lachnospiraceae bacterium]|nr:DNA-3-methyladenine glycosylase [Lachnospiraceae bacterium]